MTECIPTDYPEYYRCDSTKTPITCVRTPILYETDDFVIPNTPYKIHIDWAVCSVIDNRLYTYLRVYKNNILIDGKEFSILNGINSFDNGNLCIDMIMESCTSKYSEYLIQTISPPSSSNYLIIIPALLISVYLITKKK